MKRGKMLRRTRGRCPVRHHGSWCCVAVEIQQNRKLTARAREKRTWKKEVAGP